MRRSAKNPQAGGGLKETKSGGLRSVSRVISGSVFALFVALVFGALTLFGVISIAAGHIAMFGAWAVGSIFIATELIPGKPPAHKSAAIILLGVALLLCDLRAVHFKNSRDSSRPAVQVRYLGGQLPLYLLPHQSSFVLPLRPEPKRWPPFDELDEVRNSSDTEKLVYPSGYSHGISVPDMYVCELTNHTGNDLLDVKLKFHISFRLFKLVGPNNDSSPLAIYTEGEETAFQDKSVIIPSINVHETVRFYVVNESNLAAHITPPATGTALVSGQTKEEDIELIRPKATFEDWIPAFDLPPATYKWKKRAGDQ